MKLENLGGEPFVRPLANRVQRIFNLLYPALEVDVTKSSKELGISI
jgi:hypothetical protein